MKYLSSFTDQIMWAVMARKLNTGCHCFLLGYVGSKKSMRIRDIVELSSLLCTFSQISQVSSSKSPHLYYPAMNAYWNLKEEDSPKIACSANWIRSQSIIHHEGIRSKSEMSKSSVLQKSEVPIVRFKLNVCFVMGLRAKEKDVSLPWSTTLIHFTQ